MARIYADIGGSATAPYDTRAKAATVWGTAVGAMAAGDSLFVDLAHGFASAAATIVVNIPGTRASPSYLYGVDFSTLTEGAEATSDLGVMSNQIATNTGQGISIALSSADGLVYIYGHNFRAGTSTANSSFVGLAGTVGGRLVLENCNIELGHTNTGGRITWGANGAAAYTHHQEVELIDTSIDLNNTSQFMEIIGPVNFKWRGDGRAALLAGSSLPSSLVAIGSRARSVELEDLDLTTLTSGAVVSFASGAACKVLLRNIRTGGSSVVPVGQITTNGAEVIADRVSSTGENWRLEYHAFGGKHVNSASLVRTGGAEADDATPIGWRVTTDSNCSGLAPFRGMPITAWLDTTGSQTLTFYGIANLSALPTNGEVWIEVHYSKNSSNLQGDFATSKVAVLGTAASVTTDTSAWDSALTAWAISTSYAVGDVVKHAGSPDLAFFCTGGGTSHSSANAGFTGAADGDTFTETGGVAWRVGRRFKITATFNSQLAGRIRVYPFVGKASADIALDPFLGDIA